MLNNLSLFFRHTFNTSDVQVAVAKIRLAGNGSVAPLSGPNKADREFTGFDRVQYALNSAKPQRMLIGRTGVYESFDRGDTLIDITSPGFTLATALAYGGMENGEAKPDIAYIGGDNGIVLREGPGRGFSPCRTMSARPEVRSPPDHHGPRQLAHRLRRRRIQRLPGNAAHELHTRPQSRKVGELDR